MPRINTHKTLSNEGYFSNVEYGSELSTSSMNVAPVIEDQYDYAFTDDPVLLNERKRFQEMLYDFFVNSPYYTRYTEASTNVIKIPKDQIQEVFYYFKDKLLEAEHISAYEYVIAINEFFDFNYEYIVNKVLSSKIKTQIIEDYYKNGMKSRIDEDAQTKLF